jgi:hypothetical protein
MAAGLGFKTFTTGEVLTAGDVNGYLMQGINVFTNAAARDAAITAPAEGQFAFTKDNNSLWYYDGAGWVASGATGDIEGVTAGVGISGGGTSGTVTVTNSMATALTTKGDIVVATGSGTFVRQGVGSNNQVLMADSVEADGIKYANEATATLTTTGDTLYASAANTLARRAIGSTGQVLTVAGGIPTWATPATSSSAVVQVKNLFDNTNNTSSSTTYTDTAITLAITPTSASNKILVIVSASIYTLKSGSQTFGGTKLLRGATTLYTDAVCPYIVFGGSGTKEQNMRVTQVYLDSPATTSATTYKLQFAAESGGSIGTNTYSGGSTITLMEVTP